MHESSAFDLYEEKGRQEGRLEESHRPHHPAADSANDIL